MIDSCVMCGDYVPEGSMVCRKCGEIANENGGNAVRVKYDVGAFPLVREHPTDAGADIRTPINFVVQPHGSFFVDTGIHIELPKNTVAMIKSKSGLNKRFNILSEGVIDEGYRGSIGVKLYNHGEDDVAFMAGDKISQLVILPCLYLTFDDAKTLNETDRGNGGFGSTGR